MNYVCVPMFDIIQPFVVVSTLTVLSCHSFEHLDKLDQYFPQLQELALCSFQSNNKHLCHTTLKKLWVEFHQGLKQTDISLTVNCSQLCEIQSIGLWKLSLSDNTQPKSIYHKYVLSECCSKECWLTATEDAQQSLPYLFAIHSLTELEVVYPYKEPDITSPIRLNCNIIHKNLKTVHASCVQFYSKVTQPPIPTLLSLTCHSLDEPTVYPTALNLQQLVQLQDSVGSRTE